MSSETIFAPITSINSGSVAVIRISGKNVLKCAELLGINNSKLIHGKNKFFKITDPKNGNLIDEVLVSFFQSPKSFTGEDVLEISIHASKFIFQKISNILISNKLARMANPGEFSKRAFLNDKINLLEAEAIPDLINSETELQHQQAIRQLSGKITKFYDDLRSQLINIMALIEALIDFPDEDIPENVINEIDLKISKIKQDISEIIKNSQISQNIKNGITLTIIGEPNVGKSSFINFLTNSELAIVSPIAGTTRDIVETTLNINGLAVKIADTAGIRNSNNLIEKEGIKRAIEKAKNSDIKILILDANKPYLNSKIKQIIDKDSLIIVNKIDQISNKNIDFSEIDEIFNSKPVLISLKEKTNLQSAISAITEKVANKTPNIDSAIITQERHYNCLRSALDYLQEFSLDKNIELASEDARLASQEISKITGRIDVDNILDVIFSSFCIGK